MSWVEQSLLNPAFCAWTLARASKGFEARRGTAMPFELTFVVLPVVLARSTRSSLPRSTRTSLQTWLFDNPLERARIGATAVALAATTREAIQFGCATGILGMSSQEVRSLPLDSARTSKIEKSMTRESREILDRAGFFGRWLAPIDAPATTYALLGLKP